MKDPQLITPDGWDDYELIDSGNFEKLERFGRWVTVRPEPQAVWKKSLPESQWRKLATAVFRRRSAKGSADGKTATGSEERGEWNLAPGMPEQWWISYRYLGMNIRMRMGLTSFKHVGIFPEQAANWNYIYNNCRKISALTGKVPQILNLFAYTGGASLAARSAGAEVTHVDSVKQVVTWARENMERSGLDGVRWIVDDALKFIRREAKRGKTYDGIILDPPAYGRGPDGEKWILEQNISETLSLCSSLLAPEHSFIVLNLYSMGLSALLARSAVRQAFAVGPDKDIDEQFGELYFEDRSGKPLPLGVYYRLRK